MAHPRRPLTPDKSPRDRFGAELRRLRDEAGLSAAQLGQLVHYSGAMIASVEKAKRWPRPHFTKAVDDVLGTGGVLTRLLPSLEAQREAEHDKTSDEQQSNVSISRVGPGAILLSIQVDGRHSQQELSITDDMNRRELLRLMSMAGTLMAASELEDSLDWERLSHDPSGIYRLDPAAVDAYAALNSHLWRVFALSRSKGSTFPLVREQLDVLVRALQQSHNADTHQRLCELASELFQLAGEILFDGNQYTDAAHCYTMAASASKEAGAYDLWACALTRHSFVAVYERQFVKAAPMLELAAGLARRGDGSLSTRYWVSAVQAEALAGLGDLDACQRALDHAEYVHQLSGQVHNGGWLRFDGSRLAEERGTCYVALQRPDLAEDALSDALSLNLSSRRRASVLTDLAMLGIQRRDLSQLVTNANAALDAARQTGSGVIGRKLHGLQPHLTPFLADRRIRQLNEEINALSGVPT